MREYVDSQYSWVGNAGWTKGSHNVKFGADLIRWDLNHYETEAPTFTFNGGATALNGGASPNNFNVFADFLLGLPSQETARADTPLLSPAGANPALPVTQRTWTYGTYIRDQWELNRKMTASIGVRWEYYPFPRRVDRGFEIFDFASNRLQICGVAGSNAHVCNIKVQSDLFTPRVGWAYRPTQSTVIRVGFSRNPQNDNVIGRNGGLALAFPALVLLTLNGPNSFTPVGNVSTGVPVVPRIDISTGSVSLPSGTGITAPENPYIRGHITSYNVTLQKLLPHALSAQIGYVANRQRDMIMPLNLNYGQIGGGSASQPFNQPGLADGLRTTSSMNVLRPLGRVQYDSLQTNVTRRMTNGFQFTFAYTYAKSTDWWAGSMPVPIPRYWNLNKGPVGGTYAVRPHKMDISGVYELPFGSGRKFVNNDSMIARVVGGWQVNAFFTASSGAPFTVTSSAASLNAPGSTQFADQIKDTVAINGYVPNTAYFDVTAFKPVTDARFGTAKVNGLRGPGVANLDMSLFRTVSLSRSVKLQFRLEAFNVTNTPHFAIPADLNVSDLQLNQDGTVKNLNGFGVITSTQSLGRDYDERYFRLGLRMSF
jgi:hypothetical protein